jgi:adenylate cyclase
VHEGRLVPRRRLRRAADESRVLQAGIPLWRAYIGLQLVHPQLVAMGYMWRRGEKVQEIARAYGIQFTPGLYRQPDAGGARAGPPGALPLTDLTEHDHVRAARAEGRRRHDYVALPMRIRRDGPLARRHVRHRQRPGLHRRGHRRPHAPGRHDGRGGRDAHRAQHRRDRGHTYLGHIVGERVLNGAIKRGEGEEIRAVLWFSDLRDFTGMNERMAGESEVLELLNNYLQLVGDALKANGGEILKFIGDGVMAYFPAEDALFLPMVTGRRSRYRVRPTRRAALIGLHRHRGGQRGARRRRLAIRCASASACMSASR